MTRGILGAVRLKEPLPMHKAGLVYPLQTVSKTTFDVVDRAAV